MDLSQQSTVMEILNKVQHADDWIILLEQLNQYFNLQASQLLAVDLEVQALSFSVHHGVDFDEHQLICLALYIDIFFKVNIKVSDYNEITTVGDAIDLVKKKINN